MSPEKQRITIAESVGWVNIIRPTDDTYHFLTWEELVVAHGRTVGRHIVLYPDGLHRPLPDYLNDLNAMHEVENKMGDSLRGDYEFWLGEITNTTALSIRRSFVGERFKLAHATAAQRAEAYMRTIGKWEE